MTLRRLRTVSAFVLLAWLITAAVPLAVLAAEDDAGPPGPPFPAPIVGQHVTDIAGILDASTIRTATIVAGAIQDQTDGTLVVYTQRVSDPGAATTDRARALLDEWSGAWPELGSGIVVLVETDDAGAAPEIAFAPSSAFAALLGPGTLDEAMERSVRPILDAAGVNAGTSVAVARILAEIDAWPSPAEPAAERPADAPPPGPPFPEPELERAVYDTAGVLRPDTVAAVEAMIDRIEERTGAEVVVYTQVVPFGITSEETEQHAIALIDQWGVGRAGFDDGLAIFFDFQPDLSSGQVQLYAADGFRDTFLTNSERQSIFEEDMLPLLRVDDWDGALLAAMERIDAAATPENAQRLEAGRQINAVVGLIGAPVAFLGLVGWAVFAWRRYGKDPEYLDSPSILMPAPPPDLTAASAALIVEGRTTRRALTTALLDLASRGLIAFREESGMLGLNRKVGVQVEPERGDELTEAQRARNARKPIGPAEQLALRRLKPLGGSDDYIEPDKLLQFGAAVDDFNGALEKHVVGEGWFREKPSAVMSRWIIRGVLAFVAGVALFIAGMSIPMSGLVLIGIALAVAGVIVAIIGQWMPAVTMPGAMVRAMLAAYRRTLQKTMEQARSMDQVVEQAGLDWLDTPDQAVVWGTALGLQDEIEAVLERSLEDVREGRPTSTGTYFPAWYGSSSGRSFADTGGGRSGSIFSGSGIPNIGGMMSALGTIGNSPSSSGSGGGGFSGGSSGGGGGGAGGGF